MPARCPTASYRLQLTPEFGFDDVAARLDTIRTLGVSHLYLSPIAQAVPHSQHGYDVVDHTRIRREFGGPEALGRLLDAALDRGLGIIVDHVPNHVSVEQAELNDRWWTMLRDGQGSDAAQWFDVDWEHGGGRVIIPRLGEPIDDVLDAAGITTGVGDRGPELRYGPLRFPLAPGTEHLDAREAVRLQHYTLSWWRDPERNVRRFFTIDDLVGIRVEHAAVAWAVDTIPRDLTAHPAFAGVRVDHVDGLADPAGYLAQLRELLGDRLLFVEKILGPGERLPADWPVDGTTGYEHITAVEHSLVDPDAEQPLLDLWTASTASAPFAELERAARLEAMDAGLGPDVDRLVRMLDASDDLGPTVVRAAVTEVTLALERYRTYLPGDEPSQAVFDDAVAQARQLGDDDAVSAAAASIVAGGEPLTRWQQLTGPVMAKGAEDRAFYRYFPLASLCEVGGSPGDFSTSVGEFHDIQRRRQRTVPCAMLAATTHDTKRSSGVRARSLALAARSSEWIAVVDEWTDEHAALVEHVDAALVALALQTAVTARPLTAQRLGDYLVKAAREADLVTSWIEPDAAVEAALGGLAAVLVAETGDRRKRLAGLAQSLERHGERIDLVTLVLQLTCPGFADLYQGNPQGLFTLVDPDNRTPPDWGRLDELVNDTTSSDPRGAIEVGRFDLARTMITRRILHVRESESMSFGSSATYTEVDVSGAAADDVVAYARGDADGPMMIIVATRAIARATIDSSTRVSLPAGSWQSLLDDDADPVAGGLISLVDLMGDLPLAVMRRGGQVSGIR